MSRLLMLLKNTVFLWILLGAAIVLGLVGTCHRSANPAIPPKVQQTLDSLRNTAESYKHERDALKTSSAAATTRANTSVSQANTTLNASAKDRRIADSLALLAAATTSAEEGQLQWRAAYSARTREADSLRIVVAKLDSAQKDRERARANLADALAKSEARLQESERVNDRLEMAAKDAASCKVLWIVPCVSRTTAFAVGAVAGAATAYTVKP